MEDDYLRSELLLEVLEKRKDELRLTNAAIAERSGVPESTVTKVFNGSSRSPCFDTIAPIARVLGISLDDFGECGVSVSSGGNGSRDESGNGTSDGKELGLYVSLLCCAYEEQLRRKDVWIKFLVILLVLILILFIVLVVYDYTHVSIGYLRK